MSLIKRKTPANLIGHVWTEMTEMTSKGHDCWLSRVNQMEKLLKTPGNLKFSKFSGKKITLLLKGKFDAFWLNKVNEVHTNNTDNLDHNKLRVYKQFKSSFSKEPYIANVRNRNQRSSLTRLRVSAHLLASELGRRTRPVTPFEQRVCVYCQTKPSTQEHQPNQTNASELRDTDEIFIDTEAHFLVHCKTFNNTRNCLYAKISLFNPGFQELSDEQKFATLMCPTTPQAAKMVNKFIKLMFEKRGEIDSGETLREM
jgi:hypothetical protein